MWRMKTYLRCGNALEGVRSEDERRRNKGGGVTQLLTRSVISVFGTVFSPSPAEQSFWTDVRSRWGRARG